MEESVKNMKEFFIVAKEENLKKRSASQSFEIDDAIEDFLWYTTKVININVQPRSLV